MPTRVLHQARRGLRHRYLPLRAAASLACVALAGCMNVQAASVESPPVQEPAPMWDAPAEMIEAALEDAANRSTTAKADLKVVSASPVTWPDGSLGCPRPGMIYTQALVPGYRIVLQAGDQTMNYHAMSRGKPMFCPASMVSPPVTGPEQSAL